MYMHKYAPESGPVKIVLTGLVAMALRSVALLRVHEFIINAQDATQCDVLRQNPTSLFSKNSTSIYTLTDEIAFGVV